jgi:bifunctional UDP-N-acetylglucosamine pyrophosphorylase/glucosamine-1-phosphate N-acetyltransferase
VSAPTIVILAAGEGTRMRSATPKVLHEICGRPMIEWTVRAALGAEPARVVVVDGPRRALEGRLPEGVEVAVQDEPRGTGDAVRAAGGHLGDGPVVVVPGDAPLVTSDVIARLVRAHGETGASATLATMRLDSPDGYGRIVRDSGGAIDRVVETKTSGDATPDELAIDEVNAGLLAFDAEPLVEALARLESDNSQGEYYLPDVVPLLRAAGREVGAFRIDDPTLLLGVNDRADLAVVRAHAQRRVHREHMLAGVTIVDPATTVIEADVRLGADTVVEPSSFLRGATRAGERCRIGPLTTLIDSELGDEVSVPHSYLVDCRVEAGGTVGPFAYLRPGTVLEPGAKAGTFVEIKNSRIGTGAKVPHLSYIGDAEVGEGTNLGAATITANYDGRAKHRTKIGRDVHTSVDTTLVAPVDVGDGAYTGAGSVITEDVPPGALAIARERQSNIAGYAERKAAERRHEAKGSD